MSWSNESICGSFHGHMSTMSIDIDDEVSTLSESFMSKSPDDIFSELDKDTSYGFSTTPKSLMSISTSDSFVDLDYFGDNATTTTTSTLTKMVKPKLQAPMKKQLANNSGSVRDARLVNLYAMLNKQTLERAEADRRESMAPEMKFEFDTVCENISSTMNSFLSETYIKSLLGVFPYNNNSSNVVSNRKVSLGQGLMSKRGRKQGQTAQGGRSKKLRA